MMKTNNFKVIIFASLSICLFASNNVFASPGILDISNRIDAPYTNFHIRIAHWPGALEGFDGYDHNMGMYTPLMNPSGVVCPIYSLFEDYRLDVDSRPVDSTSTINLGLFIMFEDGGSGSIDSNNAINLTMPLGESNGVNYQFLNEDIFITINGQTYDVKKLITDGGGKGNIKLPRIDSYTSWAPYTTATVFFKRRPDVETLSASSWEHSATLYGKIIHDGGGGDCDYRFTYWKEDESDVFTTDWQSGSKTGDEFSSDISGLEYGKLYYFRAEAKNSNGVSEGNIEYFDTYPNATVITNPATNIGMTTATLRGNLIDDGIIDEHRQCSYRFSYWKNGGSVISSEWKDGIYEGDTFDILISGLLPSTLYCYRAEVKSLGKIANGNIENFTTLSLAPVVFADPNFKAVVEETIGITNPTPIDMLTLTNLSAQSKNIGSLVGLEYAYNLQFLDLWGNSISDLSPLKNLTNLTGLFLGKNNIFDISVLAYLANLRNITLIYNHISDISSLAGLNKLSSLDLMVNPLPKEAYCTYLPAIKENNPGIYLRYSANRDYPASGVLATDAIYSDKVKITWNVVCSGIVTTYYRVYRANTSSGKRTALGNDWQTNTSFDDTTALPGQIYYYWVKAKSHQIDSNVDTETNFSSFDTGSIRVDPNSSPVVFNPDEPNTLLIQNFVKAFQSDHNKPHNNQGLLTYVEKSGNSNGIDFNDVLYSAPESISSKIASLISVLNLHGQITDFNELSKDVRPDNAQDSLLEISIFSPSATASDTTSENGLKFWLAPNAFKGKTVTIQKVSTDSNIVYPVWDVNEIINKNGRYMPLSNLTNQKPNTPYAWFTLSTSRQIADVDDDSIIDLDDYAILLEDFGKTGIFRSDIASAKGLGLPDGFVDETDDRAFIEKFNELNPLNPLPNPYLRLSVDFESGKIELPWTTYGDAPWNVVSGNGNHYACSGKIADKQSSILEANIYAPSGKISFDKKVSSEENYDFLIFYIDGVEKGKWSGEQDWEEVNYDITQGEHTLTFKYIKDPGVSSGEDAAWIDDIKI
jgi:hypothetical protein